MNDSNANQESSFLNAAVTVSALGYFVDIFDLFLFGVIRIPSLKDLGVSGEQLTTIGVSLLNHQMAGVLLGGFFWGVLGDKLGRVKVLFASIFLYSSANLANGFVESIPTYAALRFIAGLGLAGELGLAITLVSETLSREKRGSGTTLVATVGLCGSVAAAYAAEYLHWRHAYVLGGSLGFLLLALRIKLNESKLFIEAKDSNVALGSLMVFLFKKDLLFRTLKLVSIGVPIWFTVGLVITFLPDYAKELQVIESLTPGKAIFFTYIGVAVGDLVSGASSQIFRSRKRPIAVFLVFLAISLAMLFSVKGMTASQVYSLCVVIGFCTGYWAVLITLCAELVGTNLRSTVTTSVPNLIRGSVVPLSFLFQPLKNNLGLLSAASITAATCIGVALLSLFTLKETYATDLGFVEEQK